MDIDEKGKKLKKMVRFFPISLFLFIPFFLASCNSIFDTSQTLPTMPGEVGTRNVDSVTPILESTIISTRQFSSAGSPLPSVTSSKTRTQVPTITIPVTTTPNGTVTPYPIRNLSDVEKLEIMDLLNKEDCELPCWNGITPGVSHIAEVQGFFARLGYDIGQWPPEEDENEGHKEVKVVGFPPGSLSYSYFYVSLQWENRIVNRIEFDLWGHPEQYTQDRIIEQLGNPSSIRIIHGVGGRIPVYAIGLLYDEINLVLEVRGNLMVSNNIEFPYQVCLKNKKEQYIKAIMYSDTANFEIEKEYYTDPWEDWAKVIGMSTEDLIQGLLDPNECIFYP